MTAPHPRVLLDEQTPSAAQADCEELRAAGVSGACPRPPFFSVHFSFAEKKSGLISKDNSLNKEAAAEKKYPQISNNIIML